MRPLGELDVLGGANNQEGHGLREEARMLCVSFVICLYGLLINADILCVNSVPNL
jgi:hypothetical protein